ncbi:hypothetical protein Bhyg_03322 [Pseudolycoriella hygida]|uniref:Uncharacterized protein n=1 Tax=Pseudolycoriella hygida TaxID=35572 RepID=A0A9Q0S7E5_9DIPT|nr:hypothetical protein Bhyg_03322 [Pseudolycoriella hygida]
MKEIVNLIPTNDPSGIDLKRYVDEVIIISLQSLGLVIVSLIADNNRVNQNVFSLLAPNGSFSFKNPTYDDRTIHLLYESIHVFKNIRNNWLNQKDEEKSFFYPSIRDKYHSEKRFMIKKAPKLSMKSLYPTNFERQKVSLALNVFHPMTIAALSQNNDNPDTAEFMEIIYVWFTIMNNRSVIKGVKERSKWAKTIESSDEYESICTVDGGMVQLHKKSPRRWPYNRHSECSYCLYQRDNTDNIRIVCFL